MGPTSIFSPLSPPADGILTIARLALALTVTSGAVVRRRGRPAREEAAAFAAAADRGADRPARGLRGEMTHPLR
jgi:hypothetical protein